MRRAPANHASKTWRPSEKLASFGASWVTIKRAKKEAGVLSTKDGMKGGWIWFLPGDDPFRSEGDQ